MVSKDVVLQTIAQLRESGIDEATIRETLKDSGIDESEIEDYLKSEPSKPVVEEAAPPAHEVIAHHTAQKVKKEIEKVSQAQELHAVHQQVAMETQAKQMEDLHEKFEEVRKPLMSGDRPLSDEAKAKMASLEKRLQEIQKDVVESKAGVAVLQSLMQKILSTDRDILLELQMQKKQGK
ncbi:MAG: hypothetical protein HY917_01900 [Candidatus Diapherotrites archaeon]|nr:hypothetical protein [Candidatus Diapherotrites archaeon]